MGRVNWIAAGTGWLACLLAVLTGAAWLVAIMAALAYSAVWLSGTLRAVLLLLAPLVLALGMQLEAGTWQAPLWLLVASLAVLPLWWSLGGRTPWQGLLVWPVLAVVLLVVLWLPGGTSFLDSDIAARGQVAVVALALLLAVAVARNLGAQSRRW